MAESHRDEIAKLESMYEANPEGRVFTHLAEAYRKEGELDHAREVLEEGLRRHRDSASGFVVLGRVMQDLGQPQEAASAFARVLELDPENRVALRALGDLARAAGRDDEALAQYEQLLALDPSDEALEGLVSGIRHEPRESAPAERAAPELVAPMQMEAPAEPAPPELAAPVDLEAAPGLAPTPAVPEAMPFPPLDLGGFTSFGGPEQPAPTHDISFALPSLDEASAAPDAESKPQPETDAEAEPPEAEQTSPSASAEDAAAWPSADAAALPSFTAEESAAETTESPEYPSFQDSAIAPPSWGGEAVDQPSADVQGGELVTETMAELYRSQGHVERAAEVYRALLQQRPGDEQLERKLLELELAILSPEASAAAPAESASPEQPETDEVAWTPPADAAEPAQNDAEPVASSFPEAAEWQPEAEPVAPSSSEAAESQPEAEPVAWLAPPAAAELAAPQPVADGADGGEAVAPTETFAAPEPEPWHAEQEAEPAAPAEEPAATASGEIGATPSAELLEATEPDAGPGPMPTMEAVLSGSGDVAASEPTPYAWGTGTADEEVGPPVSTYLRALVAWRSTAALEPASPEAFAPEEPAGYGIPGYDASAYERSGLEPPAPYEPPAEPYEPPATLWDGAPESQAPTWADEATAEPRAAESAPGEDTASAGDMDWLVGPDGVAPEAPLAAPPADSAAEGPEAPGDDDDLEMFRAWLQSLKK